MNYNVSGAIAADRSIRSPGSRRPIRQKCRPAGLHAGNLRIRRCLPQGSRPFGRPQHSPRERGSGPVRRGLKRYPCGLKSEIPVKQICARQPHLFIIIRIDTKKNSLIFARKRIFIINLHSVLNTNEAFHCSLPLTCMPQKKHPHTSYYIRRRLPPGLGIPLLIPRDGNAYDTAPKTGAAARLARDRNLSP